jgi:hypothetical protein
MPLQFSGDRVDAHCVEFQASSAASAKKVSLTVDPPHFGGAQPLDSWLKSREIKTLISP